MGRSGVQGTVVQYSFPLSASRVVSALLSAFASLSQGLKTDQVSIVSCLLLAKRTTCCADIPDLVSPSADLLLCGHHATRSSLHSHSAVKDSHCFSFTSTISTTLERLDIRILWLLCIIHPRSPTYSSISTPAATHSADVPDVFNSPHLTARVCRVSSSSHPN